MLAPFTEENGGTLLVPGSHRSPNNPTGDNGVDPLAPYPTEVNACGPAGSVLVLDSRLWHATAPNRSHEPRTSVVVRYAPWWLNVEVLRPGSDERRRLSDETGLKENAVPSLPASVFASCPPQSSPCSATGSNRFRANCVVRAPPVGALFCALPIPNDCPKMNSECSEADENALSRKIQLK